MFTISQVYRYRRENKIRRLAPVNIFNDIVLPDPGDPAWSHAGLGWTHGSVFITNFDRLEIDGLSVHTSIDQIKRYQHAIRDNHMRYMIEYPEIKQLNANR